MDPALEILQKTVAAMKADLSIAAIVGAKVFDRPPHKDGEPDVESPYISLGPHDTTTGELADCIDSVNVNFQIDAWSWGPLEAYSRAEVANLSSAIRRALHCRDVALASGRVTRLWHRQTRFLRDADGTNHAAMTFESLVNVA